MAFLPPGESGRRRLWRIVCAATFVVLLGWTIPYMAVMPFVNLWRTVAMIADGHARLLGADLTLLVPCAIGTWYMVTGPVVRRMFLRLPWFRPAVMYLFTATVGTTAVAHTAFETAGTGAGRFGIVMAAALAFLAWRLAATVLFLARPLESFVLDADGVPLRRLR